MPYFLMQRALLQADTVPPPELPVLPERAHRSSVSAPAAVPVLVMGTPSPKQAPERPAGVSGIDMSTSLGVDSTCAGMRRVQRG